MTIACTFTPPGGSAFNLNDGSTYYTLEMDGTGLPDPETYTYAIPGYDGGSYVASRLPERVVVVHVVIKAADYAGRQTAERALLDALTVRKGLGVLTVTRADSTSFALDCIFAGGGSLPASSRIGPVGRRIALTFQAPVPWFRTTTATTVTFDDPAGSAPKINTNYTIAYAGTAPSAPIITINGPAVDPYIVYVSPSGVVRVVGITYTVPSGKSVEFNFRRGRKTVILDPSGTPIDIRTFVRPVSGYNTEWFEFETGSGTLLLQDTAATADGGSVVYYTNNERL